jgi:hypothetical protein
MEMTMLEQIRDKVRDELIPYERNLTLKDVPTDTLPFHLVNLTSLAVVIVGWAVKEPVILSCR